MNTNVLKLICRMSKYTMYVSIFCYSVSFSLASDAAAQRKLAEIEYVTKSEVLSLVDALIDIEENSDFTFVYSKRELKGKMVSLEANKWTFNDLLKDLSIQARVSFRRVNETITVKAVPRSRALPDVEDKIVEQQRVSGKVTDEEGEGIPGVTVAVKGTTTGAITDIDGSYSLTVPGPGTVLVFSSIGFVTQEISVGGMTTIDVTLKTDVQSLEEVVVIGYGSVKKSDLTGSLVSLDSKSFNKGVTGSIEGLIQGRAPGVQIVNNSGEPGGGVSIRIRGASSLNAGNDPLYVIDGLPIDNKLAITDSGDQFGGVGANRNPLNALNPSDIQSIEILKDASATAIYGARGANGVILVTTKQGKSGALKVDYNYQLGSAQVLNKVDMMTTEEYLAFADRRGANVTTDGDTDWQDEIFRTAISQNHNLSFSGGDEKTTYFASVNRVDQEGIVISSGFERTGARLNIKHSISNKFNFGMNLSTAVTKDDYVSSNTSGGNNFSLGVIGIAQNLPPVYPVRNDDGSLFDTEAVALYNAIAVADGKISVAETNRTIGNFYAEYFIIPELSFRVNLGLDKQHTQRDTYINELVPDGAAANGIATVLNGTRSNELFEGLINYKKEFNENHSITAVGGMTVQNLEEFTTSGGARGFPSDLTFTNNLALGDPSLAQTNSFRDIKRFWSYLGRVNYSLYDKFLITASIRADASSVFGENNLWGYFPSFAGAYKIGEEDFIQQSNILSDLKLRVGWGIIGNADIDGDIKDTFFGPASGNAILGGQLVTPVRQVRLANPDLKWEETEQFNVGFDFGILENRINGSIDYFSKTTNNLLFAEQVTSTSGFLEFFNNKGEVKNSGLEVLLTSRNVVGEFEWTTTVNFATLKNEVTDLGDEEEIVLDGSNTTVVLREGDPAFSYFGYRSLGIDDDGSAIWQDINDDDAINNEDRVILGNPFPEFTYGINNTFSYKNFDLSIFVEGVEGVDLFNFLYFDGLLPVNPDRNRLAEVAEGIWSADNTGGTFPATLEPAQAVNNYTVVDASFIRIRNAQLNYRIPTDNISFLRSASVYVAAQNLALFTDYSGYDPDASSSGNSNIRVDKNTYPSARTILFGINIGL